MCLSLSKVLKRFSLLSCPFFSWTCSYSHRPGVNVRMEEVLAAKDGGNGRGFCDTWKYDWTELQFFYYSILFDNHLTAAWICFLFGAAQVFLEQQDFSGWRGGWSILLTTILSFFFFYIWQGACQKYGRCVQSVRLDMDLPGRPTFTDLRTVVSAHVSSPQSVILCGCFNKKSTLLIILSCSVFSLSLEWVCALMGSSLTLTSLHYCMFKVLFVHMCVFPGLCVIYIYINRVQTCKMFPPGDQ